MHTGNKIVIKNMHMFSKTAKCAFELRKKINKRCSIKVSLDGGCLCTDHRQLLKLFFFLAYISAMQVHRGGAGTRVCRDMLMNNNALFTSISVASWSKSGRPNAGWKKKSCNSSLKIRFPEEFRKLFKLTQKVRIHVDPHDGSTRLNRVPAVWCPPPV